MKDKNLNKSGGGESKRGQETYRKEQYGNIKNIYLKLEMAYSE